MIFVIVGLHIAVQEALESTVTVEQLPQQALATGFGTLSAVNGGASVISSTAVGVIWSASSPALAFGLAAALIAAGTWVLRRVR